MKIERSKEWWLTKADAEPDVSSLEDQPLTPRERFLYLVSAFASSREKREGRQTELWDQLVASLDSLLSDAAGFDETVLLGLLQSYAGAMCALDGEFMNRRYKTEAREAERAVIDYVAAIARPK